MNVTTVVVFGDEQFPLAHITVQEMAQVKSWTGGGIKSRKDWFAAIGEEDPEALLAAFMLVKKRRGEEVRWATTDFDLDELSAKFVDDEGREVEPVFDKNKDGTIKTDKDGSPLPKLGEDGRPQWVYTDTGDPVPTAA